MKINMILQCLQHNDQFQQFQHIGGDKTVPTGTMVHENLQMIFIFVHSIYHPLELFF